jgi:hypothetical protein
MQSIAGLKESNPIRRHVIIEAYIDRLIVKYPAAIFTKRCIMEAAVGVTVL